LGLKIVEHVFYKYYKANWLNTSKKGMLTLTLHIKTCLNNCWVDSLNGHGYVKGKKYSSLDITILNASNIIDIEVPFFQVWYKLYYFHFFQSFQIKDDSECWNFWKFNQRGQIQTHDQFNNILKLSSV